MRSLLFIPAHKINYVDKLKKNSYPDAIAFDLDPNFVAFHHIIRLLMILFTVPIILKLIKKTNPKH